MPMRQQRGEPSGDVTGTASAEHKTPAAAGQDLGDYNANLAALLPQREASSNRVQYATGSNDFHADHNTQSSRLLDDSKSESTNEHLSLAYQERVNYLGHLTNDAAGRAALYNQRDYQCHKSPGLRLKSALNHNSRPLNTIGAKYQ